MFIPGHVLHHRTVGRARACGAHSPLRPAWRPGGCAQQVQSNTRCEGTGGRGRLSPGNWRGTCPPSRPLGRRSSHAMPPLLLPATGTGRTGFLSVPPNNYPFYNEDEKYVPVMQADGGQLSGRLLLPRLRRCATSMHAFPSCKAAPTCRDEHRAYGPCSSPSSVQSGSRCTTPRRSRQRQTGGQPTSGACPTALSHPETSMQGCPPSRCAWSASW